MKRRGEAGAVWLMLGGGIVGAALALWTWTTMGDPTVWPVEAPDRPPVEATLLDNGFHTDLALPRAALESRDGPLAEAVRGLAPGEWILVGWGDAKFYVDQSPIHHRLPDGARAFFRPGNASVVMLDPAQQDPGSSYAEDGRRTFLLSAIAFDRLAGRIEASLDLTSGRPRVAAARPGDDARFFASRETFSILHLCNHWTAGLLQAAGMPVRPARAIVSSEVMSTVDRNSATLDTLFARD